MGAVKITQNVFSNGALKHKAGTIKEVESPEELASLLRRGQAVEVKPEAEEKAKGSREKGAR